VRCETLDTNILLDVLLNRPGLVTESEAVIRNCEPAGHSMFIAWHGLVTAYYLMVTSEIAIDGAFLTALKPLFHRKSSLGTDELGLGSVVNP